MRRNRTENRPLIFVDKPSFRAWTWTVTLEVRASGYPSKVHVRATHPDPVKPHVGVAETELAPFDDVWDTIEEVSMAAMLAALEGTAALARDLHPTVRSTGL